MSFCLGSTRHKLKWRERGQYPQDPECSNNAALEAAQHKCRQGLHDLPPGNCSEQGGLFWVTATLREM